MLLRAIPSVVGLSLVFATVVLAAPAPSPNDFVTDAIKGDNSEIMIGKLAEQNGGSAAVKKFGRTLVADHTKAKDQMTQLAEKVGVTPPTDTSADAQSEIQKLQGLKGNDFDQEFTSHMVDDHQKDIAKFEAEASAKNGSASTLAAKQLPTLRKHLKMAQSLAKA
jgi:putative membrane protein